MAGLQVEKINVSSGDFEKLKDEMRISDRYERTLRELSSEGLATLFAAKKGDKYVGRVTLRHDWATGGESSAVIEEYFPGLPQINALEVDENYRRCGVGRCLLQAVEHEAVRQGFLQVGLGVEASNVPAINLYEKTGYLYASIGGCQTYDVRFGDSPEVHTLRLMIKKLKQRKEGL